MANSLKLPVGIENFEEIRKFGFYYMDKTKLIEQLVETGGKVTLFTRPRRFGKTLNMSMLRAFFEAGADTTLFDGLYIAGNKEICEQYMGKYPVIFLSLKSVEGLSYEDARYRITELAGREAQRFSFLSESDKLSDNEKEQYQAIVALHNGKYSMDENILTSSIYILSHLLHRHYGQKTVILIDEYDVPLDKAFQNGYYREMVSLIRGLFGMALKTNDSLQFAVLTGCLRISKESIFTGFNNFEVLSVLNVPYDESFGFTDNEVEKLLDDYTFSDHYPEVKEWYDGYHFGNTDIYCPWDVIRYCKSLCADPNAMPEDFWSNSSGNAIVRRFIDKADVQTKNEIERLIAGECIEKEISLELTYDELDKSIENLWSVLFTTGYLTHQGRTESGKYRLTIPNREIKNLFIKKIREWFSDVSRNDGKKLEEFSNAFLEKNPEKIEQIYTVHGRAEDLARMPEYREQFDLCVSRAVANLSTLAEYCLPFVRLGGKFISYKSGECENEVAAAKSAIFLLGGKVEDVYKFSIGEAQRAFISLTKANGTSKKYPRKAGMPSKNPL